MSEQPVSPELNAAITKGVIIDFVVIGVGGALWWITGEIGWFIGAFVLASTAWPLLLAQAGAFTRKP